MLRSESILSGNLGIIVPVVNLLFAHDSSRATLTYVVRRNRRDAAYIQGPTIVAPSVQTLLLVGGEPLEELVFEHLPEGFYYHIELTAPNQPLWTSNVILPPGNGPVDLNQLVTVDGGTGLPAGTVGPATPAAADKPRARARWQILDSEVN